MQAVERWFAPVWFVRGALVYLSPGLALRADELELVDTEGEAFPLSPTAALVCATCRKPIAIERLVNVVTQRFPGNDRDEMDIQIRQFVADLFLRGLVGVHQSFAREVASVVVGFPNLLLAAWIDRSLVRRGGRFPVRRYRPSVRNVLRANLEAYQPLLGVGALCVVLAPLLIGSIGSLNRYAGNGLLQVTWAVAALFAAILLVAVTHELGHWYVARRLGVPCRWVSARRGLVNLAFLPADDRTTLRVAAAGPLSGVLSGLLLLVGLWLIPPDWMILTGMDQLWLSMSLAVVVVTVMQVVSATPVTSDGRVIWRLLRCQGRRHA